jgi:tetratricopeptide (TPR) repeat protein
LSASKTARMSPSLWIMDPWKDMLFFVLTPGLIIPPVLLLRNQVELATLSILVLGIGGFGHHLPGFIRAYSDPGLLRRFKVRFVLIPALLAVFCGAFAFYDLNAVTFAVAAWGTWHGAMQVNGFLRIYDSKVRSFAPMTARLDWLMCVAWFGMGILHSPGKEFSVLSHLYLSGGPLIPPAVFPAIRGTWDAATALITAGFVVNAIHQWRLGAPPSPVKLLAMASSFGFWWYCTAGLGNLLLGVVMWEIFHDIQYNALVWMFQRERVKRDLGASRVEKFLFQPGYRLALYLGLIAAYGYVGVMGSFVDIHLPEKIVEGESATRWMLRLLAVSALLHFYFDGFIWRIRERETRAGLGLEAGGSRTEASPPGQGRTLRHYSLWLFLFLLPLSWLGYTQFTGRMPDSRAILLNLAESLPDSWVAQFLTGTLYKVEDRADSAAVYYGRAVRANPDFDIARALYADMLYRQGKAAEAIAQYRAAVRLEPRNLSARRNLATLLLRGGEYEAAAGEYLAALALEPDDPELTFGAATALMRLGRLEEADAHLLATVRLAPEHADALHYLAMIRTVRGRHAEAIGYYRQAQSLAPDDAQIAADLETALRASGGNQAP